MTTERKSIINKLKKIAALADRGVGGERVNAKIQLEKLLEKYSLDMSDIQGQADQPTEWWFFPYATRVEKDLLIQCYATLNLADDEGFLRYRRSRNPRGLKFELTTMQKAELADMYKYYRKLYTKEMKLLFSAFLNKHNLFSESSGDREPPKLSLEEMAALLQMMSSLRTSVHIKRSRMLDERR